MQLGESKNPCYYRPKESNRAKGMIPEKQSDAMPQGQGITSRIQEMLADGNWQRITARFLGVICGMVLVGLLVVGLWPFHSPRNQVKWSTGGSGLDFGRRGTVLSSGKLQTTSVPADSPCSLDIWLVPAITNAAATLIAFSNPTSSRRFSMEQSLSDLVLRSDFKAGRFHTQSTRIYVHEIFRGGNPSFLTITSNGGRASVYLNGVLSSTGLECPLSSGDFDGELVVSNSAVGDSSWSGSLRGLAFYDHELSSAEVAGHYKTWTEKERPDVAENERAAAIYLFNERAGRVVHNQVPGGTDLDIPERYQVVDEVFLKPFWEGVEPGWGYWSDVLVNIAGFVPFGFLFCAYFSLSGRTKRPVLVTILLGFAVSLTIESLQWFLPTRDSDSTDVITNTLGTCYGVWLYRLKLW
jgi:hypothetical protein